MTASRLNAANSVHFSGPHGKDNIIIGGYKRKRPCIVIRVSKEQKYNKILELIS